MNESPTPAPASPGRRLLRGIAIAIYSLALTFLLLLAIIAALPVIRESLTPMVIERRVPSTVAIILIFVVAFCLPVIVLTQLAKRGKLRGIQFTVLGLLTVGAFGYLIWDDPVVRQPLTMDEISPALEGDDATYAVLMRYGKGTPAAKTVGESKFIVVEGIGNFTKDPDKWIKFVRDHRTEIEADWERLAPVRAWWDELDTRPRIGDLTPPDFSAQIMAFQPVRVYSQYVVAIATLQALDGHGDEALATLTHLYDVARKLEPNARTLVRAMIGRVLEKMAIQGGAFVLDHATTSAASRAAFAASLSATPGGGPGARHLVLIEYAFFRPTFMHIVEGGDRRPTFMGRVLQRGLSLIGRIFINPHLTENLVSDRYYRLAAIAEERKMTDLDSSMREIQRDFVEGYHVKNLGGRLFADMAIPAYTKVVESYWTVEDLRLALIKRLQG